MGEAHALVGIDAQQQRVTVEAQEDLEDLRNMVFRFGQLGGQLSGQPFETLILGKEEGRKFHFPLMAPEQAQKHFEAILGRWMEATTRTLPIHCEAGFAWITSFYGGKKHVGDHERAISEAEQAYTRRGRAGGMLRGRAGWAWSQGRPPEENSQVVGL